MPAPNNFIIPPVDPVVIVFTSIPEFQKNINQPGMKFISFGIGDRNIVVAVYEPIPTP